MVQDSGGVPLSTKGVVIGLNTKSMDVMWDVPFMSGTTGKRNASSGLRYLNLRFVDVLSIEVRLWSSHRV
ncbi:hypothetical protein BDR05DRAFT_1016559 [Suillus weaverae]|nr:hypothetical protein BDR05DRAFT_1016559 [Suillus weaverae]